MVIELKSNEKQDTASSYIAVLAEQKPECLLDGKTQQ